MPVAGAADWPDPPTLRLIIHRKLREDQLCPGTVPEMGKPACELTLDVSCGDCGHQWRPPDPVRTFRAGKCPSCSGRRITIDRCSSCPLDTLDEVCSHSAAGRMLDGLVELDLVTQKLSVPWGQISAREWRGLKVLWDEREKRRQELEQRKPQGDLQ